MRKLALLLLCVPVAAGLSTPATATQTSFTGTLSVVVDRLPAVSVTATGTANVSFSGDNIISVSLAGGTFSTSVLIPVTDPAAAPMSQIAASLTNGAGNFSTIPGGNINNNFVTNLTGSGSGTMAVSGLEKLGLFPGPLANISVPFTSGGVNGVGLGGNLVTSTGSGVGVSVRGAPWTTGTASIGTATAMGFVSGNTIQLVSPAFISTTIGSDYEPLIFSVLTLNFVPEPGTLLLLSCGVAGLALVGRRASSR